MPADTDIAIRVRTALADYLKRDVKTIKPSDALRLKAEVERRGRLRY